jgi:hypothetical protein
MHAMDSILNPELEDYIAADAKAREFAMRLCRK